MRKLWPTLIAREATRDGQQICWRDLCLLLLAAVHVGRSRVCAQVFVEAQRKDLVQMPACEACNGDKAQIESEMMVVLGIAGRHPDATENLSGQVAHRLANKANARIARDLQAGTSALWVVAALSVIPLSRFRALALFARLPSARVDKVVTQASEKPSQVETRP